MTAPTNPRTVAVGKRRPRPGFLDPIERQCLAWILGLALAALLVIFCGEQFGDWLFVTAGGAL